MWVKIKIFANTSQLDMDKLIEFEVNLVSWLGWPAWACYSIEILTGIVVVLSLVQILTNKPQDAAISGQDKAKDVKHSDHVSYGEFRWFQLQYLSVYLTIMLADWLQGTNMYTLYASYGMDIAALFLTGFLSSAVFGTCLGVYVDIYGRKLGCIVFCLLEIVINVLEHVPSMPVLLIGRVLGGISTSLLFSAFESWMVAEHRKRGFPEDWLASTFAISSWGNGLMAIMAGFLAQIAADASGDIGPFQLAIILTVVTLALILPWRENYGSNTESDKEKSESNGQSTSLLVSMKETLHVILSEPAVLCLGLSQALFEGGMFTFVFMWVPAMMKVVPEGPLPTGLVFSSLMLAMTIGGMLFSIALSIYPNSEESLAVFIYLCGAAAMAVPTFNFSFRYVFISFLVLEAMVGMFYSCGGILRSKYYPEAHQSSIMSVFRVPLNAIVVIGTLLTNNASSVESIQKVLRLITVMHMLAMVLQICLKFCGPKHLHDSKDSKKMD